MPGMKLGKFLHLGIRAAGVIFFVYLLILIISSYWLPITALAWHLRHGSTVRLGDYNIPVPAYWQPTDDQGPASVHLHYGAHHLTGGSSFGDMSFRVGAAHTAGQFRQGLEAARHGTGAGAARLAQMVSITAETKVNLAGQPSVCFQVLLSVECVPETLGSGLTASFQGTPDSAPIFHETLARITRPGAPQK